MLPPIRISKPGAVIITLVITFLLGFSSIWGLKSYGWTIFIIIPFFIGLLPPMLAGRDKALTWKESWQLAFIALGAAIAGLLVFAIEGMICIVMASPLEIILTLAGAFVGHRWQAGKIRKPTKWYMLVMVGAMLSLSFDYVQRPPIQLRSVVSRVKIAAPPQQIWDNLIAFSPLPAPSEWYFKTGIAYPTHATIEGRGVGAVRYCNFTTGSFVEPVTLWDEPNLLQFDVASQPIPMNEFNPFWDIHPPHLDGYFQSKKGQFKLIPIDDTHTILEGATWYQVDIYPQKYWEQWCDYIIHRIHLRVLNHIKSEAEKK